MLTLAPKELCSLPERETQMIITYNVFEHWEAKMESLFKSSASAQIHLLSRQLKYPSSQYTCRDSSGSCPAQLPTVSCWPPFTPHLTV